MTGFVTTPLTTVVPLPAPPSPVGDDPIHLQERQAIQIPRLKGHIGALQGGRAAWLGAFGPLLLRPSGR